MDLRLRVSRSSLECKSGKGGSGEPDRLLWLAGFRQLLALQRATLVRPTVSRRGRALARRLGIGVMDNATLERREAAHGWLPSNFAHIGGEACETAEGRTDIQLRGLAELPSDLIAFLRFDSLLASPHAIIGALASLKSAVVRQGVLPEPAGKVIAGHALIALLLAALQDASQLDLVPASTLRSRLEIALISGDPDDSHLLRVLARADELVEFQIQRVHNAYIDSGAVRQPVNIASLREVIGTSQDYFESYIDLVERLRENPAVSRNLLQTVELVCFDALVGGDAWRERAFDHLFTAEHRGLILASVRTLGGIAGDPVAQKLEAIWNVKFNRSGAAVPDRHSPPTRHIQSELFD
ncbi:hypothetical protein [Actinomadura harenae]|uniref:hypothetical protein n=1 Tax=Actinomadura harenae TaxID=2483351 RepID=UPI0011C3D14A|nr:hypothetical protein [Actinomadura harenae]